MQKGIKAIAVAALTMVTLMANGADFNQLSDSIVANGRGLRSAIARHNATVSNGRTVNNLSDPEISFDNVWGWKGIGNKLNVGVSQSFDWPTLYKARGQEADAASRVSMLEVSKQIFDLRQEVNAALIDIAYNNRQLEILGSSRDNASRLVDALDIGFRKGEVNILDVKKAKLELLNIGTQIASVTEERQSTIGTLSALSSYPNIAAEALTISFPQESLILSESDYAQASRSNNPEQRLLEAQTEQATSAIKVAKASNFPTLSVGYLYNYEFGDHFNGFSLGLTLPVFSNRHKVKAAEAESAIVAADSGKLTDETEAELRQLRQQAIMLQEQVRAYDQVLNDSDEMKRLLRRSLDAGNMSLTDYLVEINSLTQGHLDRLEAQRKLHQTLMKLNRFCQ